MDLPPSFDMETAPTSSLASPDTEEMVDILAEVGGDATAGGEGGEDSGGGAAGGEDSGGATGGEGGDARRALPRPQVTEGLWRTRKVLQVSFII